MSLFFTSREDGNQKENCFKKKFDALGKAHTTRYVSQSLREGQLVDSHKLGKTLTNQFPSCQLFRNAMRYKQLLVSSASQQPPTTRQVRHDLVAQGHNSLAEHNWVLPTPNLEGQVRHPTRGSPFLWAFTIVFTMVFTMIVLCFYMFYHGFYHVFYVFQVWYRFYGFSWQTHMKIVIWCFELVLRMFMLIMFIDLIWFDHLGMEIQKYVNNSQYLTVHRGVQHVW